MYETVKTVNGHDIYRMKGTHCVYHVKAGRNLFFTFRTIKSAAAFCEMLQHTKPKGSG